MSRERAWVESLQPRLQSVVEASGEGEWRVEVCWGARLTYAHEILLYRHDDDEPADHRSAKYETDLLIYDIRGNGDWIPRVVLECKLGAVTTHDALTYSRKAATHKHVHPYLRYGILIGDFDTALPGRLIRHGAFFDFMMAWRGEEPTSKEWSNLTALVVEEVKASRRLQALLTQNRQHDRMRFCLLHRPLVLIESDA